MTGDELLKEYPNLCTLGNVLAYMKAEKDNCCFLVKGNSEVVLVYVRWCSYSIGGGTSSLGGWATLGMLVVGSPPALPIVPLTLWNLELKVGGKTGKVD